MMSLSLRLQKACEEGDLETLKEILKSGEYEISGEEKFIDSALCRGHYEIANYLTERCGKIGYRIVKHIRKCIMENKIDSIKKLMLCGFRIREECLDHLSIASYNEYNEIVRLLLENGAKINHRPYIPSFRTYLEIACDRQNYELVILLLSYGAKIGNRALECAISRGNINIIDCLINAGDSANFYDSNFIPSTITKQLFEKHCFDALGKILDNIEDINIKKTIKKIKTKRDNFFVNLRKINNMTIITLD
ncbi:ankyrin repeat protein [Catovirus CTV1]|uniref:Ankyrin repeat protein n=1 Tax=Catovirus CTV1 TaxID=1977631 RepID=A0A1V0S8X2_9VIRU|nr:ankyrin repeat protein [Catovirus CTV1]